MPCDFDSFSLCAVFYFEFLEWASCYLLLLILLDSYDYVWHVIPFVFLVLAVSNLIAGAWTASAVIGGVFIVYLVWLDWMIRKVNKE